MRRRTALRVVSAAVGGAVVPLSFTPALAAAGGGSGPQKPTARWDFDERTGAVAREAVSGSATPVDHVFDNARYKPDSDPVRRRGVRGRALYFDGYSYVTAEGPGELDLAGGMTVDVWIAPYAYEHGIDGKPQALVNQHDPGARTGFLLGLRRTRPRPGTARPAITCEASTPPAEETAPPASCAPPPWSSAETA
ncbi:hypothetical protein [Streptomyces phaeoluteigriseus]